MLSHTFSRTVVALVFAAVLLVPAAQADDWGRNSVTQIDPAAVSAIHDRASLSVAPATVRPDDRAGLRGVGSLAQPEEPAADGTFDWGTVEVGTGAAFAVLLLAFASLVAVRHGRTRVKSA